MSNFKAALSFGTHHTVKMAIYLAIFWVIASQYFAFKWVTSHNASLNDLMGTGKKNETTFTMTADELISTIAVQAMEEAKK